MQKTQKQSNPKRRKGNLLLSACVVVLLVTASWSCHNPRTTCILFFRNDICIRKQYLFQSGLAVSAAGGQKQVSVIILAEIVEQTMYFSKNQQLLTYFIGCSATTWGQKLKKPTDLSELFLTNYLTTFRSYKIVKLTLMPP